MFPAADAFGKDDMTDIQVRVAEVRTETPSVRTLRLVSTDGTQLGPYPAGAHVDVVGPTGIRRQYSLCNPPADIGTLLIAVKREPDSRGGSLALHTVVEGDALSIGEPRNLVSVADEADRHLLVAGGIGITPLLSMAYELHRRAEDFELLYFARSAGECAFLRLLCEEVTFRDRVEVRLGVPRDEQLPLVEAAIARLTARSHVYTCGPEGFMAQVLAAAEPVVGGHVHVEHFEAAEADTSQDTAFAVELDTGEIFEVPAHRSILSVLTENGVDVAKSCEEGICGSCVSGVLDGVPDHRDNCLSVSDKAAGDQIALCVSRARTPKLVIELY
ncbi:PDR/VanB family oxidoreductase [Streptomyces sp. S.PB5]|uniref:PDR/VanB family oxidoreductase n=1 Tax=Streptomyces sp. S.PB5 TaxID=3020844 RepID=UPI0025AF9DED|nr:PDR/VanB family oxidoreductase [Streptomyces sp. S.PB5]MDN3028105.1 PDR/VanB family oxidoreductase [Streptomyces sp. S.PB5]